MQTTQPQPTVESVKRAGRRFGYALSIGINIVMLWIVYNILEWGWPPFITEDWTRVRGLVALSMIAGMLANAAYIAYDARWFKGIGDATAAAFSLLATSRLLAVYPFDYSAYGGPWDTLTRIMLIVGIAGSAIAIIVNLAKSARVS